MKRRLCNLSPHPAPLFASIYGPPVLSYHLTMSVFRELIPQTWLAGLDGILLDELETRLKPCDLVAGEDLFRQSESGDSMCLLTAGRLEVYIRDREGAQWLVVRVSQDIIEGLLQQNPDHVMKFVRRASGRLEPFSQDVREQTVMATTIALLPISLRAPLEESALALAPALLFFGAVLRLSSASFDRRCGRHGPRRPAAKTASTSPSSTGLRSRSSCTSLCFTRATSNDPLCCERFDIEIVLIDGRFSLDLYGITENALAIQCAKWIASADADFKAGQSHSQGAHVGMNSGA